MPSEYERKCEVHIECPRCSSACGSWDSEGRYWSCTCGTVRVMERLSAKVLAFLQWSWNYSVAEMLTEATTRDAARQVSAGFLRGQEASDDELVRDFLDHRVEDLDTMRLFELDQWGPTGEDGNPTWEELMGELATYPDVDILKDEVRALRDANS